jgi:predicted PurR-regulated permease PerM
MVSPLSLFKHPRARLYGLHAGMWLIGLAVFLAASRVLLPFALALLLAYVIDPAITRLARCRVGRWVVPRWTAVLLVYAALGIALWFASVAILPLLYKEVVKGLAQLRELLASLTPERVQELGARAQDFLSRMGIPTSLLPSAEQRDLGDAMAQALEAVTGWLRGPLDDVVGLSRTLLEGALRTVLFVVLLLMVTAFVSMDAPGILDWIASLVPRSRRADLRSFLALVDQGLAGVVRGQVTICVINGVLTLAGLLILHIPFAFVLSALAAVLYLVPIFGTVLSSIPIVLLALTGGLSRGLMALALILVIHALETYFLNPKILGGASRIHPVLIVLALVLGEHYFGVAGALLAVPVASLVASAFKFIHRKAQELDSPSPPPPGG